MIEFVEIASTSIARLGRTILARLLGDGDEADAGDASQTQVVPDAEVWQQWGFASRPPVASGKVEALAVAAENGMVVISTRQLDTQVQIAEGDVLVHNARTGCMVKLTAAGAVEITAGEGQNVVLMGGLLDVARKTDPVLADPGLVATVNAMAAKFNAAAGPMLSAPGTITPFTGPNAGTINGGNSRVKA